MAASAYVANSAPGSLKLELELEGVDGSMVTRVIRGEDCGEPGNQLRAALSRHVGLPWDEAKLLLPAAIKTLEVYSPNLMFPHINTSRRGPTVPRDFDSDTKTVGVPLEVAKWCHDPHMTQQEKNVGRRIWATSAPSFSEEVLHAIVHLVRHTSVIYAFATGKDVSSCTLLIKEGIKVPPTKWQIRPRFAALIKETLELIPEEVRDGVAINQLQLEANRLARNLMYRRAVPDSFKYKARAPDGMTFQMIFYDENNHASFFDTTCSRDPPRRTIAMRVPRPYAPTQNCGNSRCSATRMMYSTCARCKNICYCDASCAQRDATEHAKICFEADPDVDDVLSSLRDNVNPLEVASVQPHEGGTTRYACTNPNCHSEGVAMCGQCRAAHYCSAGCQKTHWPEHKVDCAKKE